MSEMPPERTRGYEPPGPGVPPGASRPPTPGLAVASLICGIAGFTCFSLAGAIPAVITGHLALGRIKRAAGALGGRGMAIVGLVLGYVEIGLALVALAVLPAFVVPAMRGAMDQARRAQCQAQLHQIGAAIHMYAAEHDGRLPDRLSELVDGGPLGSDVLSCPAADATESISEYVYKGAGLRTSVPNARSVVIAHDREGYHRGGYNALYLDAHVEWHEGRPPGP